MDELELLVLYDAQTLIDALRTQLTKLQSRTDWLCFVNPVNLPDDDPWKRNYVFISSLCSAFLFTLQLNRQRIADDIEVAFDRMEFVLNYYNPGRNYWDIPHSIIKRARRYIQRTYKRFWPHS